MDEKFSDENYFNLNINSEICYMQYDPNIFPVGFVRSASHMIPKSPKPTLFNQMPAFLHFRPLPPGIEPPKINCTRGDMPRCAKCNYYLSPFVNVNVNTRSWRCPLCNSLNSVYKFTADCDMVIKTDREELHHLVYDIIPPQYYNATGGNARSFCFIIDEDLLNSEIKYLDATIKQIESIKDCLTENDLISLITFSGSVTLYDLTEKKAKAYPEFTPELIDKKIIFQRNALHYFDNLMKCLKSRSNTKRNSPCSLYLALKYASIIMGGYGGKVILFSTGRVTDINDEDMIALFSKKMLSLNIFKHAPIHDIEKIAFKTGGYSTVFGNTELLRSLFTIPTAWDAATNLRVSKGCSIEFIDGSCFLNENQCLIHPIIDQSSSITFGLSTPTDPSGDFIFQFAFRFTNDKGERYIRIVNGKMLYADFLPKPIDNPSLALFLLRRRCEENNERLFISRAVSSRRFIDGETSYFPLILYQGAEQDRSLAKTASVERYGMSTLPTEVIVSGRKFIVLWAANKFVIYPEPDDLRKPAFDYATKFLGFIDLPKIYPKNDQEYHTFISDLYESNRWFYQLADPLQY